jgi:hypothetical protein
MRFITALALALVLTGTASATGSAQPAKHLVELGGGIESWGTPDMGETRDGELIRFVPRGKFAIGLFLKNTARTRIVVLDVRVVRPPKSFLHQIGTQFHRWRPFRCPQYFSCPAHGFGLQPRFFHSRPFSLARGRELGLELDYQLGRCDRARSANYAPISHAVVTFRRPGGPLLRTRLALGAGTLHLGRPSSGRCSS